MAGRLKGMGNKPVPFFRAVMRLFVGPETRKPKLETRNRDRLKYASLMKNLVLLLFILCVATTVDSQPAAKDFHSYSNPQDVRVRHLNIDEVETSANGAKYTATKFSVGQSDPILGAPLTIQLPANARFVPLAI